MVSGTQLKIGLITQGLSPVVAPLLEQNLGRLSLVVESAPRGFDPSALPVRRDGLLRGLKERIKPARSLKRTSEERGIPYLLLHKRNSEELVELLKGRRIDVVFIYSMSQLLTRKVLEVPPRGVFNLHPAMLPAYRGPNPWFWMRHDGADRAGVTLHAVDAGEDTGEIVFQEDFPVEAGTRAEEFVEEAIARRGVAMIMRVLEHFATGEPLPRTRQPAESPTVRARNIAPGEVRNLIDWENWDVERVWSFLRGTERYLEAFAQPAGLRTGMTMRVTTCDRNGGAQDNPGEVRSKGKGWEIVCRDGTVRIEPEFSARRWIRNLLRPVLGGGS